MCIKLKISDETFSGEIFDSWDLSVLSNRITVRELIRARVREEVSKYNEQKDGLFKGLVSPTEEETMLNGVKIKKKKIIDPDEQVKKAIEAFELNRVLVLAGNRQLEGLDDVIDIGINDRISFIKLVPLVGG